MAQREKTQMEIHVHEILTLCINKCGFFANPATNNMCRSCFRRAPNPAPAKRSEVPPKRTSEEEEDKNDGAAAAPEAGKVNRCLVCRKRVGLVGFRCRCGDLFCGEHRYSDLHGCGFDYKATARETIASANPLVRSVKIVRV